MKADLEQLEQRASTAIRTGDTSGIDIIGYGEISTVLRLSSDDGVFAAKRLPPFPSDAFHAYSSTFDTYLKALSGRAVRPVESWLEAFGEGSTRTVYCLQPLQPILLVDRLRGSPAEEAAAYAAQLVAIIANTVDDRIGLDAQVSNWAVDPAGNLLYLDVTTPLLRDASGREQLDTDLFIASLPAVLRPFVRRFLLDEILSHYYDARAVILDLVANLEKERLLDAVAPFLSEANRVVSPEITLEEVHKYYRSDARMWELLQRLRRADRWWQRSVRRRPYPFILPGRVER